MQRGYCKLVLIISRQSKDAQKGVTGNYRYIKGLKMAEHTKGEVGYQWPLKLVCKPIDWVYQKGTMAAVYDNNKDLVAILPQKQAKYIFTILNSHDALLAACKELLENEPYGITPYFDEALRKIEQVLEKDK
jgi:hypothetical protein